jgi:hypothetical protein
LTLSFPGGAYDSSLQAVNAAHIETAVNNLKSAIIAAPPLERAGEA